MRSLTLKVLVHLKETHVAFDRGVLLLSIDVASCEGHFLIRRPFQIFSAD